jgi:hypothetical protein
MNTWTIYRSYFEEWRWEERDDEGRVVRESGDGFETCSECVEDLLHAAQHVTQERVLH